jgi:hypothetical protein
MSAGTPLPPFPELQILKGLHVLASELQISQDLEAPAGFRRVSARRWGKHGRIWTLRNDRKDSKRFTRMEEGGHDFTRGAL